VWCNFFLALDGLVQMMTGLALQGYNMSSFPFDFVKDVFVLPPINAGEKPVLKLVVHSVCIAWQATAL
jgi:hypothetical protein